MTQHPKEPREPDHWMYAQTLEEDVERVARAICNVERQANGWPRLRDDETLESVGTRWYTAMAHAAIAATPPQWQPIETADTNEERFRVLGYGTYRDRPDSPQIVFLDWVKWIGAWSAYCMPFNPTHWMPLPAAPQAPALPETGEE